MGSLFTVCHCRNLLLELPGIHVIVIQIVRNWIFFSPRLFVVSSPVYCVNNAGYVSVELGSSLCIASVRQLGQGDPKIAMVRQSIAWQQYGALAVESESGYNILLNTRRVLLRIQKNSFGGNVFASLGDLYSNQSRRFNAHSRARSQ